MFIQEIIYLQFIGNLSKIKDGAYVINFDEFKSIGTYAGI